MKRAEFLLPMLLKKHVDKAKIVHERLSDGYRETGKDSTSRRWKIYKNRPQILRMTALPVGKIDSISKTLQFYSRGLLGLGPFVVTNGR